MPKRRCSICDAVLSSYNPEDICFCHQEGMVIKRKMPVTGCTSYKPHGEMQQGFVVPQPGEDGYNELAFTEEIVGAIEYDEEGNMTIYQLDLESSEEPHVDVYDNPDSIISIDDLDDKSQI